MVQPRTLGVFELIGVHTPAQKDEWMLNEMHSEAASVIARLSHSRMHSVVSATESYSSDEASSSGFEASLRARVVMREVRPSKESRKEMEEAAGLGEANMSVSMILRLTEMT